MGQLVLLVVAATWAAVIVPPLLRSRMENRPNSSVTDFRNQLSSLQKAMPSRSATMRTMGRPLASSPLTRPAAGGRPVLRSGVRTHNGATVRSAGQQPAPAVDATRFAESSTRPRSHGDRRTAADRQPSRRAASDSVPVGRDVVKRRRANVLFVLVLVGACSLFLAATTKTEALFYVFGATFVALCGYVYVLGQLRQRVQQVEVEPEVEADPTRRARPAPTAIAAAPDRPRQPARSRQATRSRSATAHRQSDHWSHAV